LQRPCNAKTTHQGIATLQLAISESYKAGKPLPKKKPIKSGYGGNFYPPKH